MAGKYIYCSSWSSPLNSSRNRKSNPKARNLDLFFNSKGRGIHLCLFEKQIYGEHVEQWKIIVKVSIYSVESHLLVINVFTFSLDN